ncbi:hypothetical protein [Lysinibacillus fusiformis]|uniref:hypothetical protein n=1 Tax=Lysinibacillus fusiformis TaxID=28031 RepID=UPI0035562435
MKQLMGKEVVQMSWTVLDFGKKHKGKTLPQILFNDPDWFYWAYEEGVLKGKVPHNEVQEIYGKSRNIKIPQEDHHAEFVFDGIRGVFADMKLVPSDRPKHEGSSQTQRLDRIDMALIRFAKQYDKLGYSLLIPILKEILFGDSKLRMTKKRAEDFFNDPSNFLP